MAQSIFVTGAGGFIGRHCVDFFRDLGLTVSGCDDLSAPGAHLPDGIASCSVEQLHSVDLQGFDTVVHLAASKRVDTSFEDLTSVGRNVLADSHLFQIAQAAKVNRLVFASTCEVYGPWRLRSNAEVDHPTPVSPYAIAKFASEQILLTCADLNTNIDVRIMRLFNIYGADEAATAVIPAFLACLRMGKELRIQGSGDQRRDFSYIDDAIQMIGAVATASSTPPVLNVGSGITHSISELANMIALLSDPPLEIVYDTSRRREVAAFRSNSHLWQSTMGSVSVRPLIDGIRECWQRSYDAQLLES